MASDGGFSIFDLLSMNSLTVFKAVPHVQIPIKSKIKIQVNLLSDNTSVIDLGSPYVGLKFPNILRPTKPVASRLTEAERLPQLPFFNFSRCCAAYRPTRPKAEASGNLAASVSPSFFAFRLALRAARCRRVASAELFR